MRRFFSRVVFAASSFALALPAAHASDAQPLTVFAAASLQNAFEEVGRLYQQQTGQAVRFSFAGSSALARQIEQGAPAALFASADEQWMDYLQQRGWIAPHTRKRLLGNRLVLVVPNGNQARVDLRSKSDLVALLGPDGRWVTGDPDSVPAGRYARQALTAIGAWDFARTRLVRAENVRVALAFVERGEAAAGIVYETDAAISKKVRIAAIFPDASHAPVSYPIAATARGDSPSARAFLHFVAQPQAADIFRAFGFTIP